MSKIYKNTSSRLAAVQMLYSFATSEDKELHEEESLNEEVLMKRMLEYKALGSSKECNIDDEKPNKRFVLNLIQATLNDLPKINTTIEESLDQPESLKHIDILTLSILRCAISELIHFETPYKIAIKEYVKIASTFFKDSEVSFINGVLDKVAKL